MKREDIPVLLKKQRDDFAILSSFVINIIQEKLKLVIDEQIPPPGGFEWIVQNEALRATLQMYYDGTVLLFTQTKLSYKERQELGTKLCFEKLEVETPEIFQLTNRSHLSEIISKTKKFLLG